MGCPCGPDTYDRLISRHVRSMREYADLLDDMPAKIDRNEVVARIRKCAREVEACGESIKARSA
jgi:hypothetical protein